MRVVPIEQAEPGSLLARHVYLGESILLKGGVELTPRLLDQLRRYGVHTLYLSQEGDGDPGAVPPSELISEGTRAEAGRALRRYADALRRRQAPPARPILEAAGLILDEVLSRRAHLLGFGEMRALPDATFGHAVTVCSLATYLGVHLGLDLLELKTLAVGAILHDIGKVHVPGTVTEKRGTLDAKELHQVQKHTVYGFDIIRAHREIDLRSAHVAYQHHERWDGEGYPRGLAGEQIHLFARIVSVADVFDALATDRPYRRAWPRTQAVAFIRQNAGRVFDPHVARTFLNRLGPPPTAEGEADRPADGFEWEGGV